MHRRLVALALLVVVFLVAAPLIGWPRVVRLSAVLLPMMLVGALLVHPWRWDATDWERLLRWQPTPRAVAIAAAAIGLVLFWIVLTRFQGGHINGIDFTAYYDRPLYQTSHGRPLYVETIDDPPFSQRTHLAVHAYWALLPLAALYWVHATPIWLLALSVVAVVAGAVHILRIGQRLGVGGAVASATALAFVMNDNTARTLNYGFHPEVLYAWFLPWLLDAGLRSARRSYLLAALACVLVKEDACLPLFAAGVALVLVRGRSMTRIDALLFLVAPTALALANLALYYGFVVPALAPGGRVMYANFWENYGPTPVLALYGMATHPGSVMRDAWNSGILRVVLPPFLFLPVIGWRWAIGTLPIVLVFGASANPQIRHYGIYYSIVLVPFLTLAMSSGALTVVRRIAAPVTAACVAAAVILLGALLAGHGYSLRPWRTEVSAVPRAIELLSTEPVVLVQSGLYPHAGYEARVQLLTPQALRDPANAEAAILLARRIGAFPLHRRDISKLLQRPAIAPMPGGLIAIRNRN